MVLKQIKTDLEAAGYKVFPPLILPACGKEAPHERGRVWIIAYHPGQRRFKEGKYFIRQKERPSGDGSKRIASYASKINGQSITQNQKRQISQQVKEGGKVWSKSQSVSEGGTSPNATSLRQQGPWRSLKSISSKKAGNWQASWSKHDGGWPTQSPVRFRDDGLSSGLVRESISAAGNAIVPQVVFEIFKVIELIESGTLFAT